MVPGTIVALLGATILHFHGNAKPIRQNPTYPQVEYVKISRQSVWKVILSTPTLNPISINLRDIGPSNRVQLFSGIGDSVFLRRQLSFAPDESIKDETAVT